MRQQVVRHDAELQRLEQQFVCVRLVQMKGVDLQLFHEKTIALSGNWNESALSWRESSWSFRPGLWTLPLSNEEQAKKNIPSNEQGSEIDARCRMFEDR